MEYLFFDKSGNFQWISLTVAASIISIAVNLISIYTNAKQQKKNRAISSLINTRIEYLKLLNAKFLEIVEGLIHMESHLIKDSSKSKDPEGYRRASDSQNTIMIQTMQLSALKNPNNIACEQLDIALSIFTAENIKMLQQYNDRIPILKEQKEGLSKLVQVCDLALYSYNEEEWKWIEQQL